MKIGLLGGTFDPIHIGHLILAQECWYQLGLDKIVFIPTYKQPLKNYSPDVSVADRLNMVRLALENDSRFEISTIEIDEPSDSYSINTIKYFRKKYGKETELFFITGADSIETLSMWKNVDEVLRLVTFVVATRPGWDEDCQYEEIIKRVDMPAVEISSTNIRERIRKRSPIDFFIPQKVVQYIRNKGLYRE